MATVTTEVSPIALAHHWVNPSNVGGNTSGIPVGRVAFKQTVAFPSKLAANTNVLIINHELPVNFVYRMEVWNANVLCSTAAAAADLAMGMGVRVNQNVPGGATHYLYDIAYARGLPTQPQDVMIYTSSTLYTVKKFERPNSIENLLIDTSDGDGAVQLTLTDSTTDATIATTAFTFVTYLQYSVDALHSWQLNTPTLINGL